MWSDLSSPLTVATIQRPHLVKYEKAWQAGAHGEQAPYKKAMRGGEWNGSGI